MYLLDTSVISEMRKGRRANAGVRKFFAECLETKTSLFLSVITVGELRCGAERIRLRGDSQQADIMERWVQSILGEFHNQLLEFDSETAQLWGVLQATGPQQTLDNQIAATALLYGLAVVTRNEKDFIGSGVEVLNPWT